MALFIGDLNSAEFKLFQNISLHGKAGENYEFYHSADVECGKELGATSNPTIIVSRNFENSPVFYNGNWSHNNTVDWLITESLQTIINFSEADIEPIFILQRPAFFLVRPSSE